MAAFIRDTLPATVKAALGEDADRYLVVGSPGVGQWNYGPWVAVLDETITDSAQRGYYVVYLFCEDLSGVYLSFNQGVTDVRRQYPVSVREVLSVRAADYAARAGQFPRHFQPGKIDLRASRDLTKGYELGSALACYYPAEALPSEEQLQTDLRTMIGLYRRVILSFGMTPVFLSDEDSDLPDELAEEDYTVFREHKRIERDQKMAKRVKKLKGYTCEVCDLNFAQKYGAIGEAFIEAHHLQPVSTLKGQKLLRDPRKDFAVLCSNCHRMIHKSGRPEDVAGLRAIVMARQ